VQTILSSSLSMPQVFPVRRHTARVSNKPFGSKPPLHGTSA
jgi:hypothetical protein